MSDTLQAAIDKANQNVGAANAMAAAPPLTLGTTPTVVSVPTEVVKQIDEALKPHDQDFVQADAWKQYTLEELFWWAHNLLKRATMRVKGDKFEKDLYDAGNYLGMYKAGLADYDPKNDPEKHPNVIQLTNQLRQLQGA